jgi:hypothetical protein
MIDFIHASAEFSPDRQWRYALHRVWDWDKPTCTFIGLNPSIANEVQLDPTVRRCIGFAQRWGCGQLYMLNAFAFVSGDPKRMLNAWHPISDPTQPYRNDNVLLFTARRSHIVIAAWSGMVTHRSRDHELRRLLTDCPLEVLGWTKDGYPRHPLYMRADASRSSFWSPPCPAT